MSVMKRTLLLSACVALAPCVVAAQDWSGLYGGLTLGATVHDTNHTYSNGAPAGNSKAEGLLYGGFMGYAVQNGNTVYGAEMDFEGSNATGDFVNLTGTTSGGRASLNWQGSLRAVLGFSGNLGSQPALYYLTAGYAHGDFDFRGGPSAGYLANQYSQGLDGWTVGFGVDAKINDKMAWRAEYRYTDYGTASGALAPGFPAVTMPVAVDQHAVRVGIRMNF